MAKRGPKPKYKSGNKLIINETLKAENGRLLEFFDKNVLAILQTKIKKFTGSTGAHVTVSQIYDGHKAYVIIMEEKIR